MLKHWNKQSKQYEENKLIKEHSYLENVGAISGELLREKSKENQLTDQCSLGWARLSDPISTELITIRISILWQFGEGL